VLKTKLISDRNVTAFPTHPPCVHATGLRLARIANTKADRAALKSLREGIMATAHTSNLRQGEMGAFLQSKLSQDDLQPFAQSAARVGGAEGSGRHQGK